MYSVLNTRLEYTYFTYQKTLLQTLFCLFLKSPKALNFGVQNVLISAGQSFSMLLDQNMFILLAGNIYNENI